MLKSIAYLFLLFIVYILFCVNTGTDLFFEGWLPTFPYWDKVAHFTLLGLITYSINFLLSSKQYQLWQKSILLGTTLVFAFATLEEASQYFLSTRTCDVVDLTCNYLGIFIFDRIYTRIARSQSAI